ncbi:polysaccharide pyruvyl transferase family protein [Paracoccus suum]|uniref:Polysaccharide pyruvyl transferase family protein n=1 Tax=Paracoccus suum TaxID=2259340 RepID=A0A344PM38_9RHOB|nr:polysaccharide pyruvyl transferase family protein [Paracoccus suum]AXC50443.1 polysaccharide pyruvyl transferase family protein [Paracoccus suum]
MGFYVGTIAIGSRTLAAAEPPDLRLVATHNQFRLTSPGEKAMTGRAPIKLFYWNMPNFGDALSVDVVRLLSGGREVRFGHAAWAHMAAIGSLIGMIGKRFEQKDRDPSVGPLAVWGSGVMHPGGRQLLDRLKLFAVRGPVTASTLGISPQIAMGDPGLFAADLLTERPARTDRIGLVAHHRLADDSRLAKLQMDNPEITLIDPRTEDALSVVRQIAACRLILSSSLHGLIVADSLGIPSIWLDPTGNHDHPELKFLDYAASIGRPLVRPVLLSEIESHLHTDAGDVARYQDGIERSKAELRRSFYEMLAYIQRPKARKLADGAAYARLRTPAVRAQVVQATVSDTVAPAAPARSQAAGQELAS